MISLFLLALALPPGALGLLGYDCGGTTFNVTSISLLDVGECQTFDEQTNATSTYVQLLQAADYSHIRVTSCRIEIDRQIFRCGMHSHVSIVHGGHRKYLVDLDQSACARLHNTRTFTYGEHVLIDLLPNITNYRTIDLIGSRTNDGDCIGSHFSDAYGSWNKVHVEATLDITFKDYLAPVKDKEDTVILRSGTHCKASELTCVNDEGANVFWSPLPDDKCQFHSYSVLYQGFANRITDQAARYPIVYTFTSDQITFALSRKSERYVCGYTLIQTEHPKLLVVETSRDNPFAKQARVIVENLDTFLYFNSKIVYIEKHLKTQLRALYNNIITQKCNLERQVLRNAITLAISQPDIFAYHLMKGPGYVATVAGEVAHVIKCIPVDVTRRPTDICYSELPVTHSNESMFLTPKTRILRRTGTPIDCNPLLPVMYDLKGGWVALTPKPSAVQPPQTLEPLVQPTWKYVDAEHLADSGIYTEDDLARLREHIMFPVEQPSLINNFAMAAAGHRIPVSGVSLANLLDEDALDLITQSAGEKLLGGFLKFGTISAGLMGLWIMVKAVKLIGDTIIHGYALHSVYGWSVHLLGAVFSSITSLLLHLGRKPDPTGRTDPPSDPAPSNANHTVIEIPAPSEFRNPDLTSNPSTSISAFQEHPTATNSLYPHLLSSMSALSRSMNSIDERLSSCLQNTDSKREGPSQ